MPRPPSVRSIHSWWSDSNSVGATFNLHAASKPLMGALYYLQARNFIEENAGRPLSTAIIDMFFCYLAYKYSSLATKRKVLRHLSERAASEEEASALIESNLIQSDVLDELMESPDERTRQTAQRFIERLTSHESLALRILLRYPKRCRNLIKILLLGSSGSGKSTVLNLMKLHIEGFDEHERAKYRVSIYNNVLDCAGTLARVVRRLGVHALPEEMWGHARVLLMAFPAPGGDDAESNTETESVESGSWITAIDSIDVGINPVPFTDAESNAEMESVESESWITAVDSVDVSVDPVPFTDAESNAEMESVESGSWITVIDSVDVGVDPVPFTRTRNHNSAEYHDGMPTAAPGVLTHTCTVLTPVLAEAIWNISRAPAVGRVVDENPAEFYLMDNAEYFFSSIGRIAHPAYIPSEKDILHARVKSTAMTYTLLSQGGLSMHVFDVGAEREDWIHYFKSVTSVVFCTALSDYDQVSDRRVNRMRESLALFESIVNSPWFRRTSIILFLNKFDVFKTKFPRIPLERYFPEYTGGRDPNKAAKYILWKFMQKNRARLTVYPYVAQAINEPKNDSGII
ncbi:G-protein alpha subunit [Mycena venus]|uniref:G-protein alpha subunit n=1 Tax=Mycena venus TaxID=2733690 RepID=A0A8H7CVC7_9AGAR|nr:G-protein alpha subunit [Mycena venus]